MSQEQTKIGVLGVGHLGRWHVEQFRKIPTAHLVGIFDTDAAHANSVAEEFGTLAFDSFENLLEQIQALSIVTPTASHYRFAKEALKQGKHVFVEKPVTETVEQGEELSQIAAANGLKFQVGHIERFNPAILTVEKIINNPLFIESHRLSTFNPRGTDVAVVLDLMIHDIDLVLSFIKSPVKAIHASGVSIISSTEDIANCRLEFENGAVANVTASRISTRKMRKMRFFQPDAYISVDFLGGSSDVYHLGPVNEEDSNDAALFSLGLGEKDKGQRQISFKHYPRKEINSLNYELTLFVQSIQEDRPSAVPGKEAVRALRVARQILKNIEAHAEIVNQHMET